MTESEAWTLIGQAWEEDYATDTLPNTIATNRGICLSLNSLYFDDPFDLTFDMFQVMKDKMDEVTTDYFRAMKAEGTYSDWMYLAEPGQEHGARAMLCYLLAEMAAE